MRVLLIVLFILSDFHASKISAAPVFAAEQWQNHHSSQTTGPHSREMMSQNNPVPFLTVNDLILTKKKAWTATATARPMAMATMVTSGKEEEDAVVAADGAGTDGNAVYMSTRE
jgi:hypothetical protein